MRKTAFAAILLAVPLYAAAQTWKVPAESRRCPWKCGAGDERGSMNHQKPRSSPAPHFDGQRWLSKWGAGDERGSMNHQKPAAVMNAVKLIKSGEILELAHVLG